MKINLKPVLLAAMLLPVIACNKQQLSVSENPQTLLLPGISSSRNFSSFPVTATYYVDNVNGNDSYGGTTTQYPWKTLTKVNSVTFAPGNRIRFKCGGSWTGQLHPKGSGSSGSPIEIDSYSTGARPVIAGNGVASGTVFLENQTYWEINDLEITNYKPYEEGGISLGTWESNNTSNYANVTLPPVVTNSNTQKLGVYLLAHNIGSVNHIYLHNLLIHGINGNMNNTDTTSRNNGGIYFKITGTASHTYFNDILVDSCTIHDVDHTGMFFQSSWGARTATDDSQWIPSTNVFIRANTFHNTGGHGLIVRVASAASMEYNLFDHCSIKATGNAAFCFDTDDALWQHNESRFTKANVGDHDAGGIDADFETKRTVIQYNYLHDNDFGMLITGGSNFFNQNTLIRYNLIIKDGTQTHPNAGKFFFQINGSCTNLHIYNNTIDVGPSQTDTKIVSFTPWAGTSYWPDATNFYNNIFDNSGTTSSYSFGSSTNNTFDYNSYYKNAASGQPSQVHNITGDVKFVQTGTGDPNGYRLQSGSVALSSGKVISTNGGFDYFGNTVSTTTSPNIGFYGGPGL